MDAACQCGTPERRAAQMDFPMQYNAELEEYCLVHGATQNGKAAMRYCFWCGGKLPDTKRASLFTEPDEQEQAALGRLTDRIKNAAAMRALLGEPDEIHTDDGFPFGQLPWKYQYTYNQRWNTLVLYVFEAEDGSVDFGHTGKKK